MPNYTCPKCKQHTSQTVDRICVFCDAENYKRKLLSTMTNGRSMPVGPKKKFDLRGELAKAESVIAKRPSADDAPLAQKAKRKLIYKSDTDRKAKKNKAKQMLCTCKRDRNGEWHKDIYCALHGDPRVKLRLEWNKRNGH